MKINKSWLFTNLIMGVLYFLMITALWFINSAQPFQEKILLILFCIFIGLMCSIPSIYDIFNGNAYWKYVDVDINKFELKLYENLILISMKQNAWIFYDKREEISKLKKIRTIHYYNIKKEFKHWILTPYIKIETLMPL